MDQTVKVPATVGQADTKDFKTQGEWAIIRCPFCRSPGRDKKPTFHVHIQKKKYCCTCCWVFGTIEDLQNAALGEDSNELQNKRRKEYRIQTNKNCKKYRFAPDEYVMPDPFMQPDLYMQLDPEMYKSKFHMYDHPGVNRWLEKRGIKESLRYKHNIGQWVTKLHEFEEHDVLVPNPNIAFRGVVISNYRGKEMIRYRIITRKGSMSFPEDLDPTPVVIKSLTTNKRIYFIVKNDLEAILLSQYSWTWFTVVGLGEPGIKPDRELHYMLRNADLVLVSIDNEKDGKSDRSCWWLRIYPQARWYPHPVGKDLIEARLQGLNLRKWSREGLTAF